jgi:hydrogenase maturation factor
MVNPNKKTKKNKSKNRPKKVINQETEQVVDLWKKDPEGMFGDDQKYSIFSFENTNQGIMMMNIRGFAETQEQGQLMATELTGIDQYHNIQMVATGNWFKLHESEAVEKFEDEQQQEIMDEYAKKKKRSQENLEAKRQKRDKYMKEITQNPTKNTLHLYERVTSYVKTISSGMIELTGWENYFLIVKKKYFKKIHMDIKNLNKCSCLETKKKWDGVKCFERDAQICLCSFINEIDYSKTNIKNNINVVVIETNDTDTDTENELTRYLGYDILEWDTLSVNSQENAIDFKQYFVLVKEGISLFYNAPEPEPQSEDVVLTKDSSSSEVDLY